MSLDIVGGRRQDGKPSKYDETIATRFDFNDPEWRYVWNLCGILCKRADMQCLINRLTDRERFPTPNDLDGLGPEDVDLLAGIIREEINSGRFMKNLDETAFEPNDKTFLAWALPKFLDFLDHCDSFIVF